MKKKTYSLHFLFWLLVIFFILTGPCGKTKAQQPIGLTGPTTTETLEIDDQVPYYGLDTMPYLYECLDPDLVTKRTAELSEPVVALVDSLLHAWKGYAGMSTEAQESLLGIVIRKAQCSTGAALESLSLLELETLDSLRRIWLRPGDPADATYLDHHLIPMAKKIVAEKTAVPNGTMHDRDTLPNGMVVLCPGFVPVVCPEYEHFKKMAGDAMAVSIGRHYISEFGDTYLIQVLNINTESPREKVALLLENKDSEEEIYITIYQEDCTKEVVHFRGQEEVHNLFNPEAVIDRVMEIQP